ASTYAAPVASTRAARMYRVHQSHDWWQYQCRILARQGKPRCSCCEEQVACVAGFEKIAPLDHAQEKEKSDRQICRHIASVRDEVWIENDEAEGDQCLVLSEATPAPMRGRKSQHDCKYDRGTSRHKQHRVGGNRVPVEERFPESPLI